MLYPVLLLHPCISIVMWGVLFLSFFKVESD